MQNGVPTKGIGGFPRSYSHRSGPWVVNEKNIKQFDSTFSDDGRSKRDPSHDKLNNMNITGSINTLNTNFLSVVNQINEQFCLPFYFDVSF